MNFMDTFKFIKSNVLVHEDVNKQFIERSLPSGAQEEAPVAKENEILI